MVLKYFDGRLPKERKPEPLDDEIISMASCLRDKYRALMDTFQTQTALEAVFRVISRANKYIDETAPWILAKDAANGGRLAAVMYNLLETLRITVSLLVPFIPESCERAFAQIGAKPEDTTWEKAGVWGVLPAEAEVKKGETLFPRIDLNRELEELERMHAEQVKPAYKPVLPEVPIEDFAKCDMRVCKVLACEPVKKSDRLLRFCWTTAVEWPGRSYRVSGSLSSGGTGGKTVVAILNLPARKMMGLQSEGMLISAVHEEKGEEKVDLLMLDDKVPAGATLC
jgi:methionyl-tRNA synthetase